jgi:hypothetical protein
MVFISKIVILDELKHGNKVSVLTEVQGVIEQTLDNRNRREKRVHGFDVN